MKLLLVAAALVASSAQAARWDIVSPPEPEYTVITSPEDVSRDILASPLKTVDEGVNAGRSNFSEVIHRNFPKLIEQNFARLTAKNMTVLLDGLSDQELSDLAQLYVNATSDHGLPPALLYVMADRLSVDRLARVSQHFGYQRVYPAVAAMAPTKLSAFLMTASPMQMGPVAGEMRFGQYGRFAPQRGRYQINLPPWNLLFMTPGEIYTTFRTAKAGALSVQGALFETAVVLSGSVGVSYQAGQWLGTNVVAPLIQTYAPTFYDSIGPVIGGIMGNLSTMWDQALATQGRILDSVMPYFTPPPAVEQLFRAGGDYKATGPLVYVSYGGCVYACPRPR